MVSRNNNIKSKQPSTKQNELAVYPFTVDIASLPERKYLFGIYSLSKLTFLLISISIIFSLIIVIKAHSIKIKPYFIYWNEYETRFKVLNSKETPKPQFENLILTENKYMSEFFIREYLQKTFNTSKTFVENEKNWCDCTTKEELKNSDFINTTKPCYICNFSTPEIYSSFLQNQKTNYDIMLSNGITQNINILDINLIGTQKTKEPSFWFKLAISLGLMKKPNIQITSEYKVDFILNNYKNEKIINQEVLSSYITITGFENSPRSKAVIKLGYTFNPNYDLVLKRYNQEKKQETKEVQDAFNL